MAIGSVVNVASGQELPKDVRLPVKLSLAVYLPVQVRRYHGAFEGVFQSGQTLEDTVLSASQAFFSDSHIAESGQDTPFGLLLALHPQFRNDAGHLVLTMDYGVFAADDQPLLKGAQSVNLTSVNPAAGDPIAQAVFLATQRVMLATINGLRPDEGKYPAKLDLKSRSLEFAARTEKPWATGTGFYFNTGGQILTAAHVVENCIKIDVKRDDKVLPVKVVAHSNVVDLAVLDTGAESSAFLPFRRDQKVELGEPVTSVGYPLSDILSATPTLTRGNISALGGLTGSVGQIQFSAPIQPGSSGGPVVSDGGQILGITVGTLSAAALARSGAIPQNVNFALESRYVVKFLQKYDLGFTSVEASGARPDISTVNQTALAAIVNVRCYE